MRGLVPAAGRGTRLSPLTDDRPKGLVDVGGEPLLAHVFETISPYVEEFVVVIGYHGDQIRDHFGRAFEGTPISYVEQPDRQGLADAVLRAESLVDGPFLQLNGDNVLHGNVGAVVDSHRRTEADATLLVDCVPPERAARGGVLNIQDGHVLDIVEKPDDPESGFGTTGCFAFSEQIFRGCRAIDRSRRDEYELPDAIRWLLEQGLRVETVQFDGWRVNVNTPDDIERAEENL